METVVSIPKQLVIQAVLILLNAFFAATEIAVISLNSNKLKKQVEDGDKVAPLLLKLVENPSAFLSTIQIGITLAGFLGSAFAADTLAGELTKELMKADLPISYSALNTISVVLITIILSFFTLIFGELVPKRIAQQKAEVVARFSVKTVHGLSLVLRPAIWFLSVCTNGVLKLFRFRTDGEDEPVTEDEIRLMVDAGGESGSIEEDEKEWIQNVFEFNDTSVADIMVRANDVDAIDVTSNNAIILRTIQETGRSRFPVYREDLNDVIGILTARDFLINLTNDDRKTLEEMLRPAYMVPETIHADKLFSDMQRKKQHMAIVIDEWGQTSGIITLEDLLEEIVGNIYDETDREEEEELKQLGPNEWIAKGTLPVEDLEEALDMDLPNEELEFDTVGGMVLSCLNEIPADGSQLDVEVFGLKIHVTKIEDRRIVECRISKIEKSDEESEEKEEEKKDS